MNKWLIILVFFGNLAIMDARDPLKLKPVTTENDSEQKQLELWFVFTNFYGFDQDKVETPLLYETTGTWLGTPYRYSGESQDGTDCSGFVCALYKSVYNKELNGSSKDLFKLVSPLSRAKLREGDLVFFKLRHRQISHVGIFLGNNKFVHASVKRGVMISDLDEDYYAKSFYKGGRIIN